MTEQDLWGYHDALERMAEINRDIYELRARLASTPSLRCEEYDRVSASSPDRLSPSLDKIDSMEREREELREKARFYSRAIYYISIFFSDGEKKYINLRYRHKLTFREIARETVFSEQTLYNMRKKILGHIADIKLESVQSYIDACDKPKEGNPCVVSWLDEKTVLRINKNA